MILLDQYPRNAFRGSDRMYATDTLARIVADAALDRRTTARSIPNCAGSSTCPSPIPSISRIRSDRSLSAPTCQSPGRRIHVATATSLLASVGSRTATRFLAARRRARKSTGLLPVGSQDEG